MDRLRHLLAYAHVAEFTKYFGASIVALVVDYSVYWLLAYNDVLPLSAAAVIGYSVGLIVAYLIISRKVFGNGWLKDKRAIEVTMFGLSGLAGILVTYGTMVAYQAALGDHVIRSKTLAVALSFITVYLVRKHLVFRARA